MNDELLGLFSAGYKHGYTNGHGSDGTVSSLEWALKKLGENPDTAETYSRQAASNLESRLFGAYIVRCIAFLEQEKVDEAQIEFQKAEALANLIPQSHGLIPSISEETITKILSAVSVMITSAGTVI